jgi:hypothetical protein
MNWDKLGSRFQHLHLDLTKPIRKIVCVGSHSVLDAGRGLRINNEDFVSLL